MALTKVKPGGIHADLSSAISGSANASAISGSAIRKKSEEQKIWESKILTKSTRLKT